MKEVIYGINKKYREIIRGCYDKNSIWFKHRGAKGITMCDEWLDFFVFQDWCLKNGYIDCEDRIFWVTRKDIWLNFDSFNCYIAESPELLFLNFKEKDSDMSFYELKEEFRALGFRVNLD